MGKKNLDSILIKNEKVLPQSSEEDTLTKNTTKLHKERETKTISMKIKPDELEIIRKKAGELVPTSTFLKHYLRTKTDLFNK